MPNVNEDKKRIIVLSCATENLRWQYAITNEIKAYYCSKHGYTFRFDVVSVDDKIDAHWHRTKMLTESILSGNYDYAVYMDVDAWPNLDKGIETLFSDNDKICCTVSRDCYSHNRVADWEESYVNTGVIIFKCCTESFNMIYGWRTFVPPAKMYVDTTGKLQDQSFFNRRLLYDAYYADKVDVKEPTDMNYYLHLPDWKDKFILHAAGCDRGIHTIEEFYDGVLNTVDNFNIPENEIIRSIRGKQKKLKKGLDAVIKS